MFTFYGTDICTQQSTEGDDIPAHGFPLYRSQNLLSALEIVFKWSSLLHVFSYTVIIHLSPPFTPVLVTHMLMWEKHHAQKPPMEERVHFILLLKKLQTTMHMRPNYNPVFLSRDSQQARTSKRLLVQKLRVAVILKTKAHTDHSSIDLRWGSE